MRTVLITGSARLSMAKATLFFAKLEFDVIGRSHGCSAFSQLDERSTLSHRLNPRNSFMMRFKALMAVFSLLGCLLYSQGLAQTFTDTGFTAEVVTTLPAYQPVGLTWAADGRMFIWQEQGVVRIYKNGALLPTPFLDISARVNQVNDRGLLGLALDPNFATNGYVYLLYTYEPNGNPNDAAPKTARLTRMTANPNNPDVTLANSEIVLLGSLGTAPCSQYPAGADCIGNDSDAHSVDTLRFGPDGKLYVSIGDGAGYSSADSLALRAQDLNSYNGKVLRINSDGTAPPDNPFFNGNPNAVRSKVYAYGLRNPYRFGIHPTTGEVIIGDVGWEDWEELNRGRGANFGWPCYEGNNPQTKYQNKFAQCRALAASAVMAPLYVYDHSVGGGAAIGGAFYTATKFPKKYRGNFFYGEYVGQYINRIVFDANNNLSSVVRFASNVGEIVSLEQGPDGALYYSELASGQVRRLRYTSASSTPIAVASATPTAGASPLTVNFSSTGSNDPGGSTLTYKWEFGDGTTSTAANPPHTYTSSTTKTFTAKLTVTNAQGNSAAATVAISVGAQPPVATITIPDNGQKFQVGTTVAYTGTAFDPDGVLTASSFAWQVLLHHNEHTHPYITSAGTTGSFVIEAHGTPNDIIFYEIVLTVTDSSGLKDTKSVQVYPLPPTATLPSPWVGQEVGNVALPGSAEYTNGTFTVRGSGSDIGGSSDGFYFVYQPFSGNGEIKARVATVQNLGTDAKAGVMIRASLDANSAYTLMSLSPTKGSSFKRRLSTGFGTTSSTGGSIQAPYWVRLTRSGDTFTAYQSPDGITWTQVGPAVTSSMPASVFVGLAVTSNDNAALCTAALDNVAITTAPTGNLPPTVAITTPLNGASFAAPARISLEAIAQDSDGAVRKVEFFSGSQLLHTENYAPWTFTWSNVPAGNYTLTAKATDNAGASTTSAPINLTVGSGNGVKGEYFDLQNLTDAQAHAH